MKILLISLSVGILSMAYAVFNTVRILKKDAGTPKMREISDAIKIGAMAYMHRQFKTIAVFAVILFGLLSWALGINMGIAFVVGAVFSAVAGYIGMNVSVRANVRTAAAAKEGLSQALNVAFMGGTVSGLSVVGLSLIGVSGLYLVFKQMGVEESTIPHLLIGFGFGASLISLFARVGGGIFT
ncbi:sodium/proton-translocating pyrophosphatase, partial [Candidatus Peregrinibacteria bacterium]|nr:sodium/proton-translocating pyrophosphatase [Candidatus Peregrinibacteria bacterium]